MLTPLLRDGWRLAELTVSYRTPSTVADTAQRVARAADLPVSELRAARDVEDSLTAVRTAPGPDGRPDDGAVVAEALALVKELVGPDAGRVAVVAPPGDVARLADAVAAALPDAVGSAEAARLGAQRPEDAQVTVLAPRQTKGLEFDAVVLVEPAAIAEGSGGTSDLYVAMTRPTQRLVVVHARDLPEGF
jgi:hypothetical protein